VKIIRFSLAFILALGMAACVSDSASESAGAMPKAEVPDPAHNSRLSLDWFGTYRGTLPCADCESIKTKLTLYRDNTYKRTIEYVGRNEKVFTDEGSFRWSEAGDKISIDNMDGSRQNYFVGENMLIHLDRSGQRIEGTRAGLYKLAKNYADPLIENMRWVAVEVDGQKTEVTEESRQAFILLNSENGAISGNDGCNALRGEYELNPGGSISLKITASTKMACPDMKAADAFRGLLEQSTSYVVSDTLVLFADNADRPFVKFTASAEN